MICTIIGAGAWVQSCWKCGTGGMKRCCGGLSEIQRSSMVHSECIFRRSVRACYHQWRDDFYSGHGNVLW
ncbi:hypothetical protein ACSBR2_024819 [Camellia fascicularis]